MKKLCTLISEHMALLVLACAGLALAFPGACTLLPPKAIAWLLGVVMFGMGMTLTIQDFKTVLQRPRDIAIGLLAQFTVMPGLAWLLAKAFQLDDALALGVALVGCCPGGTASNVIAYLAKGDLALSVAMTGTSTLAAPLATPLLTLLVAGKTIDVPVAAMFFSILWIVILPIAGGLAAKWLWPRATAKAAEAMPAVSTLAIALIVVIVVAANARTLMTTGWLVLAVVVLHNLCGLGLGWLAASLLGLAREKRIAIAVEVGMQNSGLASGLAAAHFATYPMAAVPGAIFSVWHNFSGAMAARFFARGAVRRQSGTQDGDKAVRNDAP